MVAIICTGPWPRPYHRAATDNPQRHLGSGNGGRTCTRTLGVPARRSAPLPAPVCMLEMQAILLSLADGADQPRRCGGGSSLRSNRHVRGELRYLHRAPIHQSKRRQVLHLGKYLLLCSQLLHPALPITGSVELAERRNYFKSVYLFAYAALVRVVSFMTKREQIATRPPQASSV